MAGSVSAALVAAGGGRVEPAETDETAAGPATVTNPPATAAPLATATAIPRGGQVRRSASHSFSFDTFDSLQTGEASVIEVLGRTHSRLLRWSRLPGPDADGALGSDLAAAWEQPEATRIVLHVDPKARWQESSALPARPVTAADIAAHLARAIELAKLSGRPAAQRSWDFATFAGVTAIDAATVSIDLAAADAFALETLASRFVLVQSQEAVEAFAATWHQQRPEQVAGSGAWIVTAIEGGRVSFRPHAAGHRLPYADALDVFGPTTRVTLDELAARDEWLLRDRRDLPLLRPGLGGAWAATRVLTESPIITTFYAAATPWNDPRLVRAIELALHRETLTAALFAGRAVPSSAIPPQFGSAAPAAAVLATSHPGFGDAESNARLARQAWSAAGGARFGPVTIELPTAFDPAFSAGATVAARLREVLGSEFRVAVDSYPLIAKKSAGHYYGNGRPALWFGWGPPITEPGVARWLSETYASTSANARATGYRSPKVDELLGKLRSAMPAAERTRICTELSALLADDREGGVIIWAVQELDILRSTGLVMPPPSPFASQHLDAGIHRLA